MTSFNQTLTFSKRVSLIALIALSNVCFAADGSLEPKITLKKSDTYDISMMTNQAIKTEKAVIPGADVNMKQTIGTDYVLEVLDVKPNGDYIIKTTFKRSVYKQSQNDIAMIDYDSATSKEVPPMAVGYAGLINQSFSMVMTTSGAVTEIKGMDALIENVVKKMPDNPMMPKDAVLQQMKSQFGDEAMKKTMEQFTTYLPDKSVSVGDKWNKTDELTGVFSMSIRTAYTLAEIKDGQARVEISGQVKPVENPDLIEMGLMKIRQTVSGSQTGTMQIDVATGFLVRVDIKQDMKMKQEFVESPMPNLNGKTQTLSVKGDIVITCTTSK
ncbi:MAG: DUF6263 family protein [Planctomycetota bacterium]